jgi:hypothetical protein
LAPVALFWGLFGSGYFFLGSLTPCFMFKGAFDYFFVDWGKKLRQNIKFKFHKIVIFEKVRIFVLNFEMKIFV